MSKKSKKPIKQKKPSLFVICITIIAAVISLMTITYLLYGEYQHSTRVHQLRETNKDIQKFGDLLEQSFPGLVTREKYCKHNDDKFGYGPLFCTANLTIKTKFPSEEVLVSNIDNLNQVIENQRLFNVSNLFNTSDQNAKVTAISSAVMTNKKTRMTCTSSNYTVHFSGERPESYGEFEFYLGCTAGPLKRPIYRLEDI